MSTSHPRVTIWGWMAVVGVSTLILAELWQPFLAGVMAILVVFSSILTV